MVKIPSDIAEIIKKIIPQIKKEEEEKVEYEQPRLEIPIYEDWRDVPEKEKPSKIEIYF